VLSLPLSLVLEHSGLSVFLSEKKTVQICFILDSKHFLLVLLLSPTLCFLSDVMVRLK